MALISATFVSFFALSSSSASADELDDVSVVVPVSCSIASSLDSAHSATINPSQYLEDIGTTTFKVFCNDNTGYALYAIGYSNEEYGNTNLLPTNTNNPNIVTGLAISGDTSNWAMKLAPVTEQSSGSSQPYAPTIENGFNSYSLVPETYTKVATFTSTTDFTIGSSLQSTYRAYINSLQPADTYEGKVRYTLVHPNDAAPPSQPIITEPGKICYYANATDAVGTMGCQTLAASQTTATLLASNFSRSGYGFAGWTDNFEYATNSNAKFYGPNEDITFTAGQYSGTNNGLSLYAVWIKSAGSLQDSTLVTSLCGTNGTGGSLTTAPTDGTANLSSVSALTDQRDNQTYAIARLADGNCWIIENLRLESTASENSTGSLAQGYATGFIGLANPESANFGNSTTANSLYSTTNITGSNQAYRFPRYNNLNTTSRATNPTSNTFANDSTTGGMYSYGNYYTWPAAIADTGNYTTNNQVISSTSICPSGWRLPIGGQNIVAVGQNGDFYKLTTTLAGEEPNNANSGYAYYNGTPGTNASNKLRSYPNNFVYSGSVFSSSVYNRGAGGYYWSSTVNGSSYAYLLYLNSSSVNPGTYNNNKYDGRAVRCVAGS